MKNINKSLIALALGVASLTACKQDVPAYEEINDTKDQAWLSVQKAVSGTQSLVIFPQIDERKDLFAVNYGGVGLPAEDIKVTFALDQKAIDSVNNVRKKNGLEPYLPFPAGSYTIEKNEATISSGSTRSEYLTLSYNPTKFDLQEEYLLALTATNAQGYKFRVNNTTILYYAGAKEKAHVKTTWNAKVSSDQASEGGGNGIASALIDNNAQTFWSSQWSPAPGLPFPHWAEVDFGKELYVTQIGLTRRQNNANGFKTFDVQGSKDGTTWTTILSNQTMVQTTLEMQKFPIEAQYLKKIKVIMKDNFNAQASTHLAEIDAIGL